MHRAFCFASLSLFKRWVNFYLFVGKFRVIKFFLEFHVLLMEKILVETATVAATVVISLKNRVPNRRRDRILAV